MQTASLAGGDTATYLYNGFGERVSRALSSGSVFHYQYLGGRLLAEINGGNGVYSREAIWLGNIPIAQVRNVSGTATLYWIHADPLATPRIITDGTGGTVWQRTQEPFGENDVVSNPVGAYTNLRFDGQFTDTLTGLSYNLMRDYDPSIGRYTTADPIGIAGGLNRYGYGMNNPLRYTDPRGECPACAVVVVPPLWIPSAVAAGVGLGALGGYELYQWLITPNDQDDSLLFPTTTNQDEYCPTDGQAQSPKNEPYITPERKDHILNGDEKGGGHKPGTGKPGKSEFPSDWSDDKIIDAISDVAKDPSNSYTQKGGRIINEGTRGGVDIRTVIDPSGEIITGFPTNTPRNP